MKTWELRGVTVGIPDLAPQPALLQPSSDRPGRALMDQIPAVLWTTNRTLAFTSCLGAGLPALGLGANQLVGMSLFEFFETEDEQSAVIAAHRSALAGEQVAGILAWGGHRLDARVGPLRDSSGNVIGTIGIGLERVAAQQVRSQLAAIVKSVDRVQIPEAVSEAQPA